MRGTAPNMSDTLTALDATFLELEEADESAHMHIGAIMVFDCEDETAAPPSPRSSARTCQSASSRCRGTGNACRRSAPAACPGPNGSGTPTSTSRGRSSRAALPAPGGREELQDWASGFFSQRLDRMRPLWEMVLLEGLSGGRWALATKTHHCMVDGVGSVDVGHLLLDTEPTPAAPRSVLAPARRHLRHARRAGGRGQGAPLGSARAPRARVVGARAGNDRQRCAGGRPRSSPSARSPEDGRVRAGDGRARGDRRGAAHEPERPDLHPAPLRGGQGAAGRDQRDPLRARRHRQRCRPVGGRQWREGAPGVARRGAARAGRAGDGADEHQDRRRAPCARQQDLLPVHRPSRQRRRPRPALPRDGRRRGGSEVRPAQRGGHDGGA